jgi:mRNA-degrading endonuclease RelE of RelBE toxin-antitoxin system
MNLYLHPQASDEMAESAVYYDERSTGLGEKFLAEIEKSISVILENPYLWAADEKGRRKCRVRRFPYQVIYRVHQETVYILAIAHTKRYPGYWENRDIYL